jgi:hypothetical protein
MSERRPDLSKIILAAFEQGARDIYTMIPAKIVKWDASNQRANCQILVKNVLTDEAGNRVVQSWPVVPGVPVQFQGMDTFRITFPISDGTLVINGQTVPATTGALIFSHRSLDKWLTGNGSEVDPEFDQAHALADAVFIPGLRPFGDPIANVPTDKLSIGRDTSPSDIEIDGQGNIQIANGNAGAARDGDSISLGACSVTLNGSGAVTKVTINGVDLATSPAVNDPGGNINQGSSKVTIG